MSAKALLMPAAAIVALAGTLWISGSQAQACPACKPRRIVVDTEQDVRKPPLMETAAAHNALGFKLLADLAVADKDKNVFISPTSISMALSMAYNGAGGETAKEMTSALQYGSMDEWQINAGNQALRQDLVGNKHVTLNIANSMWMRRGVEFRTDFIQRVNQYFAAEARALDFADPKTISEINTWCGKNTGGKIESIISQIPPEAIMYLINAVYFKGTWKSQFNKADTYDGKFTRADGKTVTVPMMTGTFGVKAVKGDAFDAVKLPYKGDTTSMLVFVPRGKNTLEDMCRELTAENWAKWLAAFKHDSELEVNLPRFKVEYSRGLKEPLMALGMKQAFDEMQADFSRISPTTKDMPVFVSEVLHKTFVEVNEEGAEAAAVTAIEVGRNSARPEFRADRPFLYAICDEVTKAILFMGVMRDPTAK